MFISLNYTSKILGKIKYLQHIFLVFFLFTTIIIGDYGFLTIDNPNPAKLIIPKKNSIYVILLNKNNLIRAIYNNYIIKEKSV